MWMKQFDIGECVIPALVAAHFDKEEIDHFLSRHQAGDYGQVTENMVRLNQKSIDKQNGWVVSQYPVAYGMIWVITSCVSRTTHLSYIPRG
jgi:hypothetical protein